MPPRYVCRVGASAGDSPWIWRKIAGSPVARAHVGEHLYGESTPQHLEFVLG